MSRCRNLFFPALAALGTVVAVFGAPSRASADFEIQFTSINGSGVVFTPLTPVGGPAPDPTGSFQFVNPSGGNTFEIQSGAGSANGFLGTITGSYNIGSITIDTHPILGEVHSALVTPGGSDPHLFVIEDASGVKLTAEVEWIDIYTVGATGGLNAGASINLINFQYSGANTTLQSLATNLGGSVTATFQFSSTRSLTQLTTQGQKADFYQSGSFSGTLTAPEGGPLPTPAPAGLVLMASGLPFLLVGRVFRRRANREEGTLTA